MITNLEFPINCISYYASNKNIVDKKNSYEYWVRGKLIRIVADRPFARGDMLQLLSINDATANNNILINAVVNTGSYQPAPVLAFVSSRLVYSPYSKFDVEADEGITVLKQVEQINNENFSIGFILLVNKTGTIKVSDAYLNNYFDIHCNLEWN